jgi:hypothetical protein
VSKVEASIEDWDQHVSCTGPTFVIRGIPPCLSDR